jgi:hypothetical protein
VGCLPWRKSWHLSYLVRPFFLNIAVLFDELTARDEVRCAAPASGGLRHFLTKHEVDDFFIESLYNGELAVENSCR